MNRRTRPSHRSPPRPSEPYLKYLKPGTLAQIRDSRMITARSHRTIAASLQIRSSAPPSSPSPPPTPGQVPSLSDAEFPCFSGWAYGPRCPQRKKLVAAKSAVFFPPMVSPAIDASSDPIMEVFGGGGGGGGGDIAAH